MESYQKISQSYKPEVQDIWEGNIVVEEKVDGSQFRIEISEAGEIKCGSHHVDDLNLVDNTFKKATDAAQEIFAGYKPTTDITIFCEYLGKEKQNAIAYGRTPKKHLVVFDVKMMGQYFSRTSKEAWASNFEGLEVIPLLWSGNAKDFTDEVKQQMLAKPSYLGHQAGYDRIEGIVVKNYDKFYDVDKYPYLEGHWLCTKIVNDSFKEKNKVENPSAGDKFFNLKESLRAEPRWRKAKQHLDERGEITNELSDLGKIIPEIKNDIIEEEKEVIKEQLWKLYGNELLAHSTKGVAEWYKEELQLLNK